MTAYQLVDLQEPSPGSSLPSVDSTDSALPSASSACSRLLVLLPWLWLDARLAAGEAAALSVAIDTCGTFFFFAAGFTAAAGGGEIADAPVGSAPGSAAAKAAAALRTAGFVFGFAAAGGFAAATSGAAAPSAAAAGWPASNAAGAEGASAAAGFAAAAFFTTFLAAAAPRQPTPAAASFSADIQPTTVRASHGQQGQSCCLLSARTDFMQADWSYGF